MNACLMFKLLSLVHSTLNHPLLANICQGGASTCHTERRKTGIEEMAMFQQHKNVDFFMCSFY